MHPAPQTIENDRGAAQIAVLADDGYGLGILFTDQRAQRSLRPAPQASLAEIERQFSVCR